jgi:hypothetical protein
VIRIIAPVAFKDGVGESVGILSDMSGRDDHATRQREIIVIVRWVMAGTLQ